MGVRAGQVQDRDDRPQSASLLKEVLSPREALCDACLDDERRRRALARAIWIAAIIFVLAHLTEVWSS